MQLRNHPLMTYGGIRSWPPLWHWIGGDEDKRPKGEVGILKDVTLTRIKPPTACYLIIEYAEAKYMGSLLIEASFFCYQVCDLLQRHIDYDMYYIGGLDVDHIP
jgi:hypothetical protein